MSRLGGIDLDDVAAEVLRAKGSPQPRPAERAHRTLDSVGSTVASRGRVHMFNPTVFKLKHTRRGRALRHLQETRHWSRPAKKLAPCTDCSTSGLATASR